MPRSSDPARRGAGEAPRGRGATFNPDNRYRRDTREAYDDGWATPVDHADALDAVPVAAADATPTRQLATTVTIQRARTIISRNDSPDIPFTQAINPYQGCEHGCIYCYARPTHAYLDLSPGLDFETRLFAKPDAAALLRAELARPGYVCDPITLGSNTDAYQPIERECGSFPTDNGNIEQRTSAARSYYRAQCSDLDPGSVSRPPLASD